MRIGRAVRRTIKEAPAIIHRPKCATFPADKRIGSETLRQHAIQADESAFGIIAAQRVQGVTSAVKRIDAVLAGPEIELAAARAQHAHAQAPMLLLITGNPRFLRAAGRENA